MLTSIATSTSHVANTVRQLTDSSNTFGDATTPIFISLALVGLMIATVALCEKVGAFASTIVSASVSGFIAALLFSLEKTPENNLGFGTLAFLAVLAIFTTVDSALHFQHGLKNQATAEAETATTIEKGDN